MSSMRIVTAGELAKLEESMRRAEAKSAATAERLRRAEWELNLARKVAMSARIDAEGARWAMAQFCMGNPNYGRGVAR